MGDFTWLAELEDLSPAALTVRAQTIDPNDRGNLLWDAFMPRSDVDSIKLAEMTTLTYRPASDRREWNQRGRRIPMITPEMREMEMVPVEATDAIDEYEMQLLFERFLGNQQLFRDAVRASIPQRVDALVEGNYRRVEVDTFKAWSTGTIVQMDPQTGALYTASYGFDAARYQTPATKWDAATNAYDEFLAWLRDGLSEVGSAAGAMLRLAPLRAIEADAPTANGITLTTSQLAEQVSQDLGQPFEFYLNENTVHTFDDGGSQYTQTNIWPSDTVALVPRGERVGTVAFAPVVRAMQLAARVPDASIDIRGQTVFYDPQNGGRRLEIEAQVNAMPVPSEQLMWVAQDVLT